MKNFKLLFTFLFAFTILSLNAQTINLSDQCNCEVFKSTTAVTAGATSPTGAGNGDLLVDSDGNLFYWDGNSWELTTGNVASLSTQVFEALGTNSLLINEGSESAVPGVSQTITLTETRNVLITVTGYAIITTGAVNAASQGAFALYQNGTKISSGYTSMGDGGGLTNLPSPATFQRVLTLAPGTYTFEVRYAAWFGNQTVNFDPVTYAGYNGDNEAMLTRMTILTAPN